MTFSLAQKNEMERDSFLRIIFNIFQVQQSHDTNCTKWLHNYFLKLIFYIFENYIFFETVNHRHVKVLEQSREEFPGFVPACTVTESRRPNKFKTGWPKSDQMTEKP